MHYCYDVFQLMLELAKLYLTTEDLDQCQHQCMTLLKNDTENDSATVVCRSAGSEGARREGARSLGAGDEQGGRDGEWGEDLDQCQHQCMTLLKNDTENDSATVVGYLTTEGGGNPGSQVREQGRSKEGAGEQEGDQCQCQCKMFLKTI